MSECAEWRVEQMAGAYECVFRYGRDWNEHTLEAFQSPQAAIKYGQAIYPDAKFRGVWSTAPVTGKLSCGIGE